MAYKNQQTKHNKKTTAITKQKRIKWYPEIKMWCIPPYGNSDYTESTTQGKSQFLTQPTKDWHYQVEPYIVVRREGCFKDRTCSPLPAPRSGWIYPSQKLMLVKVV